MAKQKYSNAEKRAYWMGVGCSMRGGNNKVTPEMESFIKNSTVREYHSFQNGFVATAQNLNFFKNKKNKKDERK